MMNSNSPATNIDIWTMPLSNNAWRIRPNTFSKKLIIPVSRCVGISMVVELNCLSIEVELVEKATSL